MEKQKTRSHARDENPLSQNIFHFSFDFILVLCPWEALRLCSGQAVFCPLDRPLFSILSRIYNVGSVSKLEDLIFKAGVAKVPKEPFQFTKDILSIGLS